MPKGRIPIIRSTITKINPTQTQRKRKVHVGSAASQDISKVSVDHSIIRKSEHQSPRINLWLLFPRLIYSRMLKIGGSILELQGMFAMNRAFSTTMIRWMMERFSTWATLQQLLLKAKASGFRIHF